jgi:hypothetical protein
MLRNSRQLNIRIIAIGLAVSLPFIIILGMYNLESYGNIFASGYSITRGETFTLENFNGLNVLFSIHRGWLIYSPLFVTSLIGLFLFYKENKRVSILSLGGILLGVLIYGFWPTWWGGGSFGSRFMLYTLPFCCVGLAVLLNRIKYYKYNFLIYLFIILSTIYSTSLMFLYRVTPIDKDFYLPTYFFSNQIDLINQSYTFNEYITKNLNNLQLGSGIPLISLGEMSNLMTVSEENKIFTFKLVNPPYSNYTLPSEIEGYLVNKQDRKVYKINITLNQNSFSLETAAEVFGIDRLPLRQFSGARVNSTFDIYLENGKNISLRGEVINWIPPRSDFLLIDQ